MDKKYNVYMKKGGKEVCFQKQEEQFCRYKNESKLEKEDGFIKLRLKFQAIHVQIQK